MMDPGVWQLWVMPIGGTFIALMCWIFFFPKADKEPRKRRGS